MSNKLRVNEIFYSLQGEGSRVGAATVFVRLSGCNLKCSFCDTKHEKFKLMTAIQIEKEIRKFNCRAVCITGGEPMTQEKGLLNLLELLRDYNYYIQMETNGTIYFHEIYTLIDLVTVSPKKKAEYLCLANADEIKVVITPETDFYSILFGDIYVLEDSIKRYLQPMSNSPKMIAKCINFIKEEPEWKLSLQIQKIINIK